MKKLMSLIVALMVVLVLVGCSGVTTERSRESHDLRKSAGNGIFCADPNLAHVQMFGN
jgi:uncharacterized protein YceK